SLTMHPRGMFYGLLLLFLLVRILFLDRLPVFNDESIYLHWGLEFFRDPREWVIPILLDGKQPGMSILFGPLNALPIDPVTAGRMLSIGFSFLTLFITLKIASFIFRSSSRVSLMLLMTFCPFLVFYDRLALLEAYITFCFMLTLYFFLLFTKKPRFIYGMFAGVTIALGWFVKSTILLSLPPLLISLVLFSSEHRKNIVPAVLFLVAGATAFAILTLPLRLNPLFALIQKGESSRLMPLSQFLALPTTIWFQKILATIQWLIAYMTPPGIILVLLGWFLPKRKNRTDTLILFWAFLPILSGIFFTSGYTSRYIVLSVPLLLLISAQALSSIGSRYVAHLVIACMAIQTILMTVSPLSYFRVLMYMPLAQNDYSQYVKGFPSGWGVKEARTFIQRESQGKRSIVFVRLDSGNPEDAMYVSLSKTDTIRVLPLSFFFPLYEELKKSELLDTIPLYFVSRGYQRADLDEYLKELVRFPKPLDEEFVGVYRMQTSERDPKDSLQ
ncbi:MAG: glycosyltransferase family 39 protein, partial [bacterium]|nr:glycosyltransferase family 39 protein [bacterium]